MKFKALVICVGLLAPAGIAVAMQRQRVEQIASFSAGYRFQDLQVKNSLFNSTQITSQLDSDGCAVCMEDDSDWSGRNLRGANFWSSSLKGANFSRSDLTGANFSEANLTGANLTEANLSKANLQKANLSHADLTNAQLQEADLRDAILFGANLQNANLQGANLTGAVLPAGFTGEKPAVDSTKPLESSSTKVASLETMARETTVLIEGASQGSGVIIARSGTTYYVATAKHVISQSGLYSLQTYDGKQHQLLSNAVKVLRGVDLAVLEFTSDQNYRVARLANSDLLYGVESTSTPIYTAGFPARTSNKPRRYVLSQGQIMRNSPGDMAEGYSLFYTNATLGGMSGGPIWDTDGRVVGIHGRGFTEGPLVDMDSSELFVRYGVSLGVPINTLLQLASQTGMRLPVQIDSSAPEQGRGLTSDFSTLGSSASNTPTGRIVKLCNQGFDLLLSNQLQASMAAFTDAVQIQPDSPVAYLAWYGSGSVFQAAGQTQNAIDAYNKALELRPDFYSALLEKGYILHQTERYSEAVATFNQIINDSEPVDLFFKAQALLWRGQSHFAQEDMQKAIRDYSEAIQANPDYAVAYFQRAAVYQVLRNKPVAIQDYQKASEIYLIQGNMAAYQNAKQIMGFLQK